MFDFSWGELILIGAVALIVIGPKELPGVLRAIGQWTTKIRRMAAEFQSQFQEAMREADMADLKREIDTATQGFTAPLETKDATKWEPKAGEAGETTVQPADAPLPQAALAHDDIPPATPPADISPPSQSVPQSESGSSAPSAAPAMQPEPAPVHEPVSAASSLPGETAAPQATPPAPAAVGAALDDTPVPQRSERA
jgi:sec-independent protein translocase protein TatB